MAPAHRIIPGFLALAFVIACAASAAEPIAITGRAMGTTWTVKFYQSTPPAPALDPATLTARIASSLDHLENLFSTYRPASELSRFNASASTDWHPVSPELAQLAAASHRLSELTAGAFDVTVGPLVRLWGFGPQRRTGPALPTVSEISTARARVDYRRLEIRLSPPALRKTSADLSVDFSSMAKGFAADALSELLTTLHAPHHLVQIGGDLKTSGPFPWRTAIEQPTALTHHRTALSPTAPLALARTISLSRQALSTSGDSHNFTTIAGRRYSHIIDPRTGRPTDTTLASVSVIHDSCATSSALATALFVLGPDAGYALATREHLACLFIVREGDSLTPRATPAFDRLAASPLR